MATRASDNREWQIDKTKEKNRTMKIDGIKTKFLRATTLQMFYPGDEFIH